MCESAEAERLGHERQILMHRANFRGGKGGERRLEIAERQDAAAFWVVMQVSASGPCERANAGRPKSSAIVDDVVAELGPECRQQHIDIQRGELHDGNEVGRAREIGVPEIERRNEWDLAIDRGAVGLYSDAAPLVHLDESAVGERRDHECDLIWRQLLGPPDKPRPLVVQHEQHHRVQRIAARNRAPDQVNDDVAASRLRICAGAVRQFAERRAGDAARRKHQCGFFVQRQRFGRSRTSVSERTAIERSAFGEPARTARRKS